MWKNQYVSTPLSTPVMPKSQLGNHVKTNVSQHLERSNEYDKTEADQNEYLDSLEGDINCPACLLQVNRLERMKNSVFRSAK